MFTVVAMIGRSVLPMRRLGHPVDVATSRWSSRPLPVVITDAAARSGSPSYRIQLTLVMVDVVVEPVW